MGIRRSLLILTSPCIFRVASLGVMPRRMSLNRFFTVKNEFICKFLNEEPNQEKVLSELALRKTCNIALLDRSSKQLPFWTKYLDGIQLDCCALENSYHKSGKCEIDHIRSVDNCLKELRERTCRNYNPDYSPFGNYSELCSIGLEVVKTASFVSRSLQQSNKTKTSIISKDDLSPVTIADFAVQAFMISQLIAKFPTHKFIAEEESHFLRENQSLCDAVIRVLNTISSGSLSCGNGENSNHDNSKMIVEWDREKLFQVLDMGRQSTLAGNQQTEETGDNVQRVWVLDPIDGTKGFVRGEHYCISLSLMENGKPVLSFLGCPNIQLQNIVSRENIAALPSALLARSTVKCSGGDDGSNDSEHEITVFPPDAGTIFFAVSGHGAFMKSLGMPLHAAVSVSTNDYGDKMSYAAGAGGTINEDVQFCEGVESTHGDRDRTARVASRMRIKKPFVRLDGQTKYGVVGAGGAEATFRLPPRGYQEKIWDHVAGFHFVTEAGGRVTDLAGEELDFSTGVNLKPNVTGILASNGVMHKTILEALK